MKKLILNANYISKSSKFFGNKNLEIKNNSGNKNSIFLPLPKDWLFKLNGYNDLFVDIETVVTGKYTISLKDFIDNFRKCRETLKSQVVQITGQAKVFNKYPILVIANTDKHILADKELMNNNTIEIINVSVPVKTRFELIEE